MTGGVTKRFRVQSVVFDLFNTLVNPDVYRPEGFTRARRIAEVLGLADPDDFVKWWRGMEAQRHVNRLKRVAQYADEYLMERVGRRCTEAELAQINEIWGQMHDLALLKPPEEALSALRRLGGKGVKLGLLSNIDEREAVCWSKSPLAPLLDAVCLSYETGHRKPANEAYAFVLSRLGADAQSSIYVGDGNHDELGGAKRAGFGLVVFMKGFIPRGPRNAEIVQAREVQADVTVLSLNELPDLVDQLQSPAME
jgi:putative hydrolase of the HAD superfamily